MGIKGSNEVSEGLTAVYQFEHSINTSTADQTGGRLSYVGLSGGFGTLTLGQVWGAAYNNSGGLRDINNFYGGSDVTGGGRVGNAVSYAFSSGAAGFQVDAIMDSEKDTGDTVDQLGFGVTINLGEFGKLGLGYENVEDAMMASMKTGVLAPHSMLTANDAGMFDKSELDVRDKTSGKPIVGTIASVAHTIGGKAAVLQQVYTMNGVSGNLMGPAAAGYKMAGGKLYGPGCLTDAGVPNTGNSACTDKTWAYVQTMNTGAPEGKVTTTYNIFVVAANADDDLLKVMDSPGTPPVSERSQPVVRMLTVIDAGTGNIVSSTDNNVVLPASLTSSDLAAHRGTTVSVYVDSDGDAVAYRSDTMYYSAVNGAALTVVANRAAASDGDYYLDDDVLTLVVAAADETMDTTSRQAMDTEVTRAAVPAGDPTMHPVTHAVTMNTTDMDYGHTSKHVSAQFNLGVLTLGLGFTETESNDPKDMQDAKTTYIGASGSIGDTGMSWVAQARNKEDHMGMESSPWTVGLGKSLGDGARMFVEHQNSDDGKGGSSVIGLRADF